MENNFPDISWEIKKLDKNICKKLLVHKDIQRSRRCPAETTLVLAKIQRDINNSLDIFSRYKNTFPFPSNDSYLVDNWKDDTVKYEGLIKIC